MLPATARCVVCVYPRKGKVILAVMTNSSGQMTLAGSLLLGGYGRMGMVGEMQGVAAQANSLYAAYLESLFARAGLLSGDPKREQPILEPSDPTSGRIAGNVLELVKIAPRESRGISILSMALALALVFALCVCGGQTTQAEQNSAEAAPAEPEQDTDEAVHAEPETASDPDADKDAAPAEDVPLEGEYTLFALQNGGYTADSNEMDMYSTLTLAEDGTGTMTMDEDAMGIESWAEEDGALTIVLTDGSTAQAAIRNGIIELDIWGNGELILVYAREDADTSAYSLMTLEELQEAYAADMPDSRLYALWESLDTEVGVHMSYDRHTDYMDADQSFEVHGKDGVYYSLRTTNVSGFESATITFFRDGTAYNLDPEDMTGIIATTTTSSYIMANIMSMDSLYSDIQSYAQRTDYTEETREMNGASYTVEVFPATDYTPEAAFYFDDAGHLAWCITGAPVVESAIEIGESVYTIHTIDDAVDEALFDISGYAITE